MKYEKYDFFSNTPILQFLQIVMTQYRKQLDIEIGHLIKSPCRDCRDQDDFPGCARTCSILNDIQILLSTTVSCTRKYGSLESFAASHQGWQRK